jgi:hypothetical protein
MNPKTIWQAIGVVASLGVVQPSVQAAVVVVDTVAAPIANANAVASGRVVDGVDVATWTLSATVNNNNFNNVGVTGGPMGLQYQMTNTVVGSTATNTIDFSVNPLAGYEATGLTVSQSPYNNTNDTWNGGTSVAGSHLIAQFVLNWVGGGLATITDPADQLAGLITGSTIASGATVIFSSGVIRNSVDAWSIAIPGTASAQVIWSGVSPIGSRALNAEWVSFDPIVSEKKPPVVIPVPGTILLIGAGLFGLLRVTRRS